MTLAIWPAQGNCSSIITARVLQVGTYANGNLFISFDKTIDEDGCAMPAFELPQSSPAFKAVLATATLAFATKGNVEIKTDSCFMGVTSFSGSRGGYLVVK